MQFIYSSVAHHVKHTIRLVATMIAAAKCFLFVSIFSGTASAAAFSPEGATMIRPWSYGDKSLIFIEGRKDGTVVVSPSDEQMQSATVIICHGLGDTAEDWCDIAKRWATQMPYVKFILPSAPTQPVTLCKGKSMPSWFDIGGSDERSNKLCHGILQSRDRIHAILGNEYNHGIPYSRMVLVGFSQGGALCLFAGLSLPPSPTTEKKLAGILVMSAFLAGMSTFQHTPGLEDTNILHLHGLKDPKVHYSKALKCKELLSLKGMKNYKIITYPGLQHTVTQNELEDALIFLRRTLPPLDDQGCLHIKTPDISTAGFKTPRYEERLNEKDRQTDAVPA